MKIDAEAIKRNHDLRDHAGRYTTLKRVTSKEMAGPCPKCGGHDRFHCQRGWFFCRQCYPLGNGQAHDIFGFYEWGQGWDFMTACQHLSGERPKLKPVARAGPEPVNEDWQSAAIQIMVDCAAALWEPEGERARRWLNDRGLADETLKGHFIGFNSASRTLHGLWVPRGITIPHWQESLNRIWGIKIRLATNGPDKYRAVKHSLPCLYLADNLVGHEVAVICEGEFDALLLAQEAGAPSTGPSTSSGRGSGQAPSTGPSTSSGRGSGQGLVGVVALGSAGNKVKAIDAGLPYLLPVKRLLVATDNDEEGERAAAYLLERTRRARRLRPPQGNDVTDFWKAGGDLREWIAANLPESPETPWIELKPCAEGLGGSP